MHYINFHTHSSISEPNTISVKNLLANTTKTIIGEGPFTIGIHPWDTNDGHIDNQVDLLMKLVSDRRVLAIGEIGLDKLRGAALDIQIQLFEMQLQIAVESKKPVIIHCVKAWTELFSIKKNFSLVKNWAIHGFRGDPQLAASLVNASFYISFGEVLLKSDPKICEAIKSIPLEKLFLETDDSGKKIQYIFQAASDILSIPIEKLKSEILNNYQNFFNLKP